MANEYNIDLHDSKGRESKIITGEFGSDEDIAKTLLQAIKAARHHGYCRMTLDIALEVPSMKEDDLKKFFGRPGW